MNILSLSEMEYGTSEYGSDLSTFSDLEAFGSLDGGMAEDVDVDVGGPEYEVPVSDILDATGQELDDEQPEQPEQPEPDELASQAAQQGILHSDQFSLGAASVADLLNFESYAELLNFAGIGQPNQADGGQPFNLLDFYSDWRTLWHICLMFEQSTIELFRILGLLQGVVDTFEEYQQEILTAPPAPSAPAGVDDDIINNTDWTLYRQHLKEVLRCARYFANSLQERLYGDFE